VDIMKREGGARGPGGDVLSSPAFDPKANDRSLPALFALLNDKDDGVKQGAADALGKIGDPRAVDKLLAVLRNPQTSADVHRVVIGAIALIAAPSGEQVLTDALNNPDDDSEARAQAAAGLGRIGTPSAITSLIKALSDDDLNLRAAASAALARAGKPSGSNASNANVQTQLILALSAPRQETRLGAAQALQAIQTPNANNALLTALTDPANQPDVRSAAAAALGYQGNQAAVAPLIQALSDRSGAVQVAAQNALAAIGAPATDALIAATRQGGATAFYAAGALGQEGDLALPALERAAGTSNPVAQRWAAVALGETNQPRARAALEQLANSPNPDVAYVAKEQLNHLGRAQ
jgi:HEAT repeat protein